MLTWGLGENNVHPYANKVLILLIWTVIWCTFPKQLNPPPPPTAWQTHFGNMTQTNRRRDTNNMLSFVLLSKAWLLMAHCCACFYIVMQLRHLYVNSSCSDASYVFLLLMVYTYQMCAYYVDFSFFMWRNSFNLAAVLLPLTNSGKLDILLSQVSFHPSSDVFFKQNFKELIYDVYLDSDELSFSNRAKSISWCWVQIILLMSLTQVSSLWITIILIHWIFTFSLISHDTCIWDSCISYKSEIYDNWAP